MFDKFRDGENLYFDLDVCIYNKLPNLIRKDLTVYMHGGVIDTTSFNSSIISWTGDNLTYIKHLKKILNIIKKNII